jgi:hypothetical protein
MIRNGKGPPPEKVLEVYTDKRNKNYKKRRRKKNKMWKYASSMNEFFELQKEEICCKKKNAQFEVLDHGLKEKETELTAKYDKREKKDTRNLGKYSSFIMVSRYL